MKRRTRGPEDHPDRHSQVEATICIRDTHLEPYNRFIVRIPRVTWQWVDSRHTKYKLVHFDSFTQLP